MIPLDDKEKDQIREQMAMTPQERMNIACQLIDFAKAFAVEKEPSVDSDVPDSIRWIILSVKK